jgi:hypothetical protein
VEGSEVRVLERQHLGPGNMHRRDAPPLILSTMPYDAREVLSMLSLLTLFPNGSVTEGMTQQCLDCPPKLLGKCR